MMMPYFISYSAGSIGVQTEVVFGSIVFHVIIFSSPVDNVNGTPVNVPVEPLIVKVISVPVETVNSKPVGKTIDPALAVTVPVDKLKPIPVIKIVPPVSPIPPKVLSPNAANPKFI